MPSACSLAEPLRDLAKVALLEPGAVAELREALPRARQRLAVPVEAQQPPVGRARAQDGRGVAAEAHRAVDEEPSRPHREQLQRLGEENGDVARIRSHTPPGASRPRR